MGMIVSLVRVQPDVVSAAVADREALDIHLYPETSEGRDKVIDLDKA